MPTYSSILYTYCSAGSVINTKFSDKVTFLSLAPIFGSLLQSMYRYPLDGADFLRSFHEGTMTASFLLLSRAGIDYYFLVLLSLGSRWSLYLDFYDLIAARSFLILLSISKFFAFRDCYLFSFYCLIFNLFLASSIGGNAIELVLELFPRERVFTFLLFLNGPLK